MKVWIFLISLLWASVAYAQVIPKTQGLYLNLDLVAGAVNYDDDDFDDNGGLGAINLGIGYGFTPTFTLYAQLSGGQVSGEPETPFTEDYSVAVFELMARFHFGQKIKSPVFYLEGGLQGFAAQPFTDPDVELSGAGLVIAPGLLVYLGPNVALDFNLAIAGGNISEIKAGNISIDVSDNDLNYGLTRLSIGASWYPGR